MLTRSPKGFTLLELLIVIAIIGILSAVVLVSLNQARTKGADAAIKSALAQARRQAELFNVANGNDYTSSAGNVCDNANVNSTRSMYFILNDLATKQGYTLRVNDGSFGGGTGIVVCNDDSAPDASGSGWAIEAPLKSTTAWFCMDSKGNTRTRTQGQGGSMVVQGDITCD